MEKKDPLRLWIDFQSQNLIFLFFIFILTCILAFLSYRFTLPPLSSKKRAFLLVLRWLSLFFLFLSLAEALLGFSRKSVENTKIALLLDSSRSMNAEEKTISRKEVLQSLLEDKSFKQILSKAEIYPYLFSDSLVFYSLSEKLPLFSGEATSIGNSLEELKEELKEKNLSAVILFSDGANNKGRDPIAVARNYNLPIYAVGIGEFVPFKDLSIEKIEYDEVVYSGEKDTLQISIKNQGYDNIKVQVFLQEKEKVLAQGELQFGFSGEVQKLELSFEPGSEGLHRYRVLLSPGQGEDFTGNNQKSFTQKVLKKKFKLLLLTQSLDWEYTFLKRYLTQNKDISYESIVFSRQNNKFSDKPALEEKLKDYDLLVLLDSPQFLLEHKEKISELLKSKGYSILLWVGEEFYQRKETLSSLDFLPFEIEKESKPLRGSFNLSLTPAGRIHPVTFLSDDIEENFFLWENLPPFERLIGLKEKEGAKSLAVLKRGKKTFPGIILKEENGGKIEVLTFSPLWKWEFLPWGIGKEDFAYKRFWENSFRWLLSREDLERFRIFTDKEVYKRGEEIKFNSRLLDENYQKVKGAQIGVKLFPEGEEKDSIIFNLVPEDGDYTYIISFLPPAKYFYQGEAKKEGFILGTFSGKLQVEKESLEDEDLKPDKELLKEIALLSGGEYAEPENFSLLLGKLNLERKSKIETKEIPLWQKPLLLILFILFLSLEWFFRKRFQLL